MFASHRSHASSQSRRSSIDSLTAGLPPNPWTHSSSDVGSRPETRSSDQNTKVHAPRRSSVFTLRSRSNTSTSTTPSLLSLSHSAMAEHESTWHASPPDQSPFGSQSQNQSELFKAGARRSFFRGKKGKRLSETVVSSADTLEYSNGGVGEKRTSLLRKGKKRDYQPETACKAIVPDSCVPHR